MVDPEAKHYRRMRSALWLFVYLVLHADRQSGLLKRKLKTISLDMGIGERTIRGWLMLLRRSGYIETRSNGRCLIINVTKWKAFARKTDGSQCDTTLPGRPAKACQSGQRLRSDYQPQLSNNSDIPCAANDMSIKRYLLHNDIENRTGSDWNSQEPTTFRPKDRVGQLALDLAQSLDDLKGIALYVFYARKYPESFLRMTLGAVKEIPREKIKRSRAALFNFLVQQYAKEGT